MASGLFHGDSTAAADGSTYSPIQPMSPRLQRRESLLPLARGTRERCRKDILEP
jgi:hypothetical protein